MQFKSIVIAAVAATLALSSLSSFAQTYDKSGKVIIVQKKDNQRNDRRDNSRDQHGKVIIVQKKDDHRNDHRDNSRDQQAKDKRQYYYNARGPEFVRGRVLPHDLRTPQYVVVDYRQHRLAAPPRGKQWVQVGADYVLVAVATGIIANIVLNR